jgi:hypothetical protein
MICMRPTMLFFGAAAACVVIATTIYRRRESSPGLTRSAWAMVGLLAVLLGAAQAARDYLLSGWLLYPLSIHAFDVPWRAVDPIGWRTATLVAARDPLSTDAVFTANSWYWIPGWFGRLWSQWETYFFLLGLLVAIVALLFARRRGASLHIRRVLACALPSAVSVLAWFTLSPPSYRFIWGSLFTLFLIPFSAAITATHARDSGSPDGSGQLRRVVLVSAAVMLLGFTSFSILFRNQVTQITEHRSFTIAGLSLPYAIAPIPVPPTQSVTTSRGLELQVPTESDQCWDVYPLCSFSIGMDIGLRGPSIQDGFIH